MDWAGPPTRHTISDPTHKPSLNLPPVEVPGTAEPNIPEPVEVPGMAEPKVPEEEEDDELTFPRPRPSSQVLGSTTSTTMHLFILVVLIMLSFDTLNPVKRLCTLAGLAEWGRVAFGWAFVCFLVLAVLQDLQSLVFYSGRVFFNSMLSIFISRIDVIGMENIPQHGPAILVANHFNQFIDGMCVMCACPQRRISFLIARKSYTHPIIGFFARAMAAVPVTRPQDVAFAGSGALLQLRAEPAAATSRETTEPTEGGRTTGGDAAADGQPEEPRADLYRLVGSEACRFCTELGCGDKLSFVDGRKPTLTWVWRVTAIESNAVCFVRLAQPPCASSPTASPVLPPAPLASLPTSSPVLPPYERLVEQHGALGTRHEHACGDAGWTLPASGAYRVLPRGDYDKVFPDVVKALDRGACLGIFPEGGSHDRTDLLELKPGVALLALSAQLQVPIVPVGLSYFRGHVFRSAKVTVHVGPPILASKAEKAEHAHGGERRQRACTALLARIERAMRDVIVPVSSFEELQLVHVVRRLWCGPGMSGKLESAVRQDLDRRFAFGIRRLLRQLDGGNGGGNGGNGGGNGGGAPAAHGVTAAAVGDGGSSEASDVATELRELKALLRQRELAELMQRLRRYDQELIAS
jgi:1-acyl-sn-glycerol-3-phosphate acyltransferase